MWENALNGKVFLCPDIWEGWLEKSIHRGEILPIHDDEVGVHDDLYDSDDGDLDDVDDDINEKGHSMQRDVPSYVP